MTLRWKAVAALGIAAALGLTACGSGSTEIKPVEQRESLLGSESAELRLKVGTTTAPNGHYVMGLLEMQRLLEEYSGGTMTLDIYPNSQLGNERDMMESVGLGIQEMALISTGPIPNFVPEFSVLDFPYIFEDAVDAYEKLDGPLGQELLGMLESQRIYGVGFWENGFRELSNNTKEVLTPDDLKGMKIRTMENNVHIATYEALGATATPMAWSEIFTGLQQGVVDGQENPIPIIETSRVYEVQKYISMIDLFYSPCVLMINKKLYDTFSEDQKNAFDRAAEEAKHWQRTYSQDYNAEAEEKMTADGVVISDVDKEVWKQAASPVYKDAGKFRITQEFLDKWTQ